MQRVGQSAVYVGGEKISSIDKGLLVFLGVGEGDNESDALYLSEKIAHLRVFEDEVGKLNFSCLDVGGSILVVSQFTLYGDCRKGRRPSFSSAAPWEQAEEYYKYFIKALEKMGIKVAKGEFGEEMTVTIQNQGPMTILLDSKKCF